MRRGTIPAFEPQETDMRVLGRMRRDGAASRAAAWAVGASLMLVASGCGPLAAGNPSPGTRTATHARASDSHEPITGTWVTEITGDDLAAAGITDAGLVDENTGRFTTSFHEDGTWDQLQESLTGASVTHPVWKGTWTVEDDELVQVTTFPPQYAGDRVRFTFSADGDTLRLRIQDPPDPMLPVVTDTHPWTRVAP
jgi:hypothetical protein